MNLFMFWCDSVACATSNLIEQTRDHEELEPGRGRDTFPSQFTDYNGGRPLNVQKCVKEGERNVALD